jgi:hypothetical protein
VFVITGCLALQRSRHVAEISTRRQSVPALLNQAGEITIPAQQTEAAVPILTLAGVQFADEVYPLVE